MPKRKNNDYIEDSDEAAGDITTSKDKDNKDTKMEPSESTIRERDDDRGENGDGEAYFKLSEKKRVTVRKFKNMILIDFREFFTNSDGESNPTKKGIKFDLHATPPDHVIPKCISQYVPTDTLVVVTIKIGTGYNQKIDVEVTDNSDAHNKYGQKRDLDEETRIAFTTHADADISICFVNILDAPNSQYHRTVDLDVDVGAEAIDYNQLVKSEKLKPMEAELRKLEQVVQEIVDEMEYLRSREARMRDTNVYTSCTLKEVRKQGKDWEETELELQKFEQRRCLHRKKAVTKQDNPHNYCIATQNELLRESFRNIPGVPLLYINRSVLIVEPPSRATLEIAKKAEFEKTLAPRNEIKFLKKTNSDTIIKEENEIIKKKRKFKGVKEPNPL
ncbi:8624_t:CDS:10, partial [Diversispora eburnea]